MRVETAASPAAETDAGLLVVGICDGDPVPEPFADAPGALDAAGAFKRTAVIHPDRPARVLVVGLGRREDLDHERVRVAAAIAARHAGRIGVSSLAWLAPEGDDPEALAAAVVEGTVLALYRFDRYRKARAEGEDPPPQIERLVVHGDGFAAAALEIARVAAEAQNRARTLQNLPANALTPTALAERAGEIAAAHDSLSVEVLGPREIAELGMGGLLAVASGTEQEPRLIVLRYAGGEGDALGLVGKGVTFDSGGISIKPAPRMQDMKMDMSGAAAVIEAVAAIAELGLSLNVVAVVPSTENLPSGSAVKPGDIITQYNGRTVEVNNTDAEGRLILADALAYCAEQEDVTRIIDLATLTGAMIISLGSTYAGLMSNDDELAARVEAAGTASGELAWRLPLHAEYKDLTRGRVADLTNASEKRKASSLYAASFLEEFVGDTPWAHLDIAGTSWDVGREYVGSGASGYGVRLLVALARDLAG